jgi:glycopeptide antibiotics resistance protein
MLILTLVPFGTLDVSPEIKVPYFDKMVHMCLFGIHVYLMAGYLKDRYAIYHDSFWFVSRAIALSFLFGLLIEIMQYFLPERSFEILDLMANFFGIMVGILIFYVKFNFFTN